MAEEVVVDASALVDLLLGGPLGEAVASRLAGHALHGPSHLDAEVLSGLGRLHRAGLIGAPTVSALLKQMEDAPVERHPVAAVSPGAWNRRAGLRLADALYVELADSLNMMLITTDTKLTPVEQAYVVTV